MTGVDTFAVQLVLDGTPMNLTGADLEAAARPGAGAGKAGRRVSELRLGGLFEGYGGLTEGVRSVLGGTVAWHSEIDPGACKILAHRYPDVPNLGDITAVDWANVEPVDVLTGGSPCQDVSAAGKRAGMRAGTRSGLWASMCDAIEIIRPGLVVWENVRGVLSAHADSAVEPCPICVGDERDAHLRALGRVVGDLSELGYVGRWVGLRAADVGAPHGRYRIFVVAQPAGDSPNALGSAGGRDQSGGVEPAAPAGVVREAGRGTRRGDRSRGGSAVADAHGDALREQPVGFRGSSGSTVAGHAGADAATHPHPSGRGPSVAEVRTGESDADRCTAADTDCDGLEGVGRLHPVGCDADGRGGADIAWGQYESAVRRWEQLTRRAPTPTERGSKGQARLSPAFVEWLMGLPAGWVTDVPGLSRNEQLKALGNGVVPQQAAAALRMLLPDVAEVAA
jgi:DNA (cytosine-5)-methyltransferase 1